MKKCLSIVVILLSTLIIGCDTKQKSAATVEQEIEITVNPTIELFSLIHHLAGDKQYNENLIPGKNGYDVWNVVLNEYLVRACNIMFLKENEGIEEVERNMTMDKMNGFVEIEGLVQLLEEYENNRKKYPDIESFRSRIRLL